MCSAGLQEIDPRDWNAAMWLSTSLEKSLRFPCDVCRGEGRSYRQECFLHEHPSAEILWYLDFMRVLSMTDSVDTCRNVARASRHVRDLHVPVMNVAISAERECRRSRSRRATCPPGTWRAMP